MKPTLTLLTALLLAPLAALHAAEVPSESSNRIVNAGDYGLNNIPTDRWDAKRFHENPDSTEAIQAACDAGAGRTVYIPAGLYRVTKPIRVQSGTQVMDAGFCATRISTEKPIAIFHLQNIIQGQEEYGLAVVRCKRVTLTANVIRSTSAGPGMILDQCRLSSISANNVSGSGKDGIAITGGHDLSITGNVVDSCGLSAASKEKTAGIAIDAQSTNCDDAGNIPKPTVGAGLPEPKSGDPK